MTIGRLAVGLLTFGVRLRSVRGAVAVFLILALALGLTGRLGLGIAEIEVEQAVMQDLFLLRLGQNSGQRHFQQPTVLIADKLQRPRRINGFGRRNAGACGAQGPDIVGERALHQAGSACSVRTLRTS